MKKAGCILMSLILTLSAAGCKPQVNSSGTPVTTANFTIDPAVPESEAFQLPGLLSSQAVLQQNTVLKMWGQYAVDGPIAVKINDQTFYGECKDGAFELLVKTPAASKENTVTFYSATEKKTITDVWFGEVFLCAGQTNMQFTMAGIDAPEFQQTDFTSENLRIATVPVLTVDHPVTEPYTETAAVWQNIDSGTLASASAVGYYFGVEMQKNLRCPVGIVVCAAGDTIIASWLSTEDVQKLPPIYQGETDYWVRSPAHMYNTMLHPILNYYFRSVIWYQGENQSYQYDVFLTEMIQDWRQYFQRPDLPFTVIELVACGESWLEKWPEIRAMQRKVCETLGNCTLSVGVDLGEEFEIHPTDKQPVGQRAAYATLNALYSGDKPNSPVLKKASLQDQQVVLEFTNAQGLKILGDGKGFEVSPDGKAYYAAQARVEGEKVLLTYDGSFTPAYVRYAWANFSRPLACLYNGGDMPADSFLIKVE